MLFLIGYPIIRVLIRVFVAPDGSIDLGGLGAIAQQAGVGALVGRTVLIVGASAALALVIGTFLAWLNERTNARWGAFTDSLPMVPFLLPPIAGAVGWLLLASPRAGYLNDIVIGLVDRAGLGTGERGPFNVLTVPGIVFVYMLYMIPYVFVTTSAGFRNINADLEEQSRVCGGGLIRTVSRVTAPAIKPSIASAILLIVWFGASLYSVPAILGAQGRIEVLSVRIVDLIKFSYPPKTDAAIGLSILLLAFVGSAWLFLRVVLRSGHFSSVGGKGKRSSLIDLGGWKWLARALFVMYILAAAVLPVLALLTVSLTGFWSADISVGSMSVDSLESAVFGNAQTAEALKHSVLLAVAGATIAIVFAAPLSIYIRRSSSRVAGWIDGGVKLPGTITHVVLAVGFVLAFAGSPFYLYGSVWILLIAYIAVYFPEGSIAADAAATQVGNELNDASRICGASMARTFRQVDLPIMLPGLVAGWALMFARMAGDLNVSAILSGSSNLVMGFQILQVNTAGNYAQLGGIALALTVISASVTALAISLPRWMRKVKEHR